MIKIIIFFICLAVPVSVYAQQDAQDQEASDYSYGEVISTGDQELSVLEYDYEKDEEQTVRYTLDPQTVLTNINKVGDLTKGQTVEVYFKTVNGARVAQMIIKDDTSNPVDDQTPAP